MSVISQAMRLARFATLMLLVGCSATSIAESPASQQSAAASNGGVYELRTYTAHPGKLAALHDRFNNYTMRLFERHGMTNVAYWTPVDTDDTLVYLLRHPSTERAAASWKAFVADPEWRSAYAASIADGPLVAEIDSVFLEMTDYSPVQQP